jgi:broad specificity phosphatase PhoE
MKRFVALLLFSAVLVSIAAAQSTIFIVRHAEKADSGGSDPDLTEAGRGRALSLANMLKDSGISAIYTTELKRTQQTAAPLALLLHLDPAIIPAKETAVLVDKLRAAAGNILVVGHGNTIPDLIKAFGITTPINIAENDYDNLFVLILEEKPRLIRLHYH